MMSEYEMDNYDCCSEAGWHLSVLFSSPLLVFLLRLLPGRVIMSLYPFETSPLQAGTAQPGGQGLWQRAWPLSKGSPAESRLRLLTLLLGRHSRVFVQAFIMTPFKQVAATDKTHAPTETQRSPRARAHTLLHRWAGRAHKWTSVWLHGDRWCPERSRGSVPFAAGSFANVTQGCGVLTAANNVFLGKPLPQPLLL